MEQYPDGYVDVKRPEELDENNYRSRQYSQDAVQPPSPHKPQLGHASSSASANTASTSYNYDSRQHSDSRPSLSNDRRLSSGLGGGMGSLGSIKTAAQEDVIPVGFDEGILRGLCDLDCALPLLADRIKQSIASCKQVAVFFRSRADIEEKYARSMTELCRTTGDVYARADCKAGSFVSAYQGGLKLQEQLAQNRIRFSQRLNEMSDELLSLAREGEKMRKVHKDNGTRYQGILQESEQVMDKAKARFDSTAEELERLLVAKEGESFKDAGMRSSASTSSANAAAGPGAGGGKRALNKAINKGGLLFKGKGAGSMQRQEDDVRARMAQSSETFRKAVLESQALRQEYFNFQLPKILRLLKECADELDLGTQYHLTRYAFLYESTLVSDGTTLNPMSAADEGPGLKTIYESIDNRSDFKSYMQNYAVARGTPRGPRREGPYEEGFLPPLPPHIQRDAETASIKQPNQSHAQAQPQGSHVSQISIGSTNTAASANTNGTAHQNTHSTQSHGQEGSSDGWVPPGIPAATGATFGVDLGEQLARDGTEVPKVVEKCAQAIEAYGLESMGIYRLSGTTSRVQALKNALDRDIDGVDVLSDEWSADINVVSGALKLWFRELPEPLLTYGLYHSFIEAARYENDRLRHIRLHEQVNELPDPNYATLKFFMGHLDRVRRNESVNQMSVSNLSIVFGPTLLGAPPEEGGLNLEHMSFQCKAIETILEKYSEIFVEEEDGGHAGDEPAGSA
ncbi:GTPase activating protein [Kwoniella heveanensis CBS 569]|uniref:GTPase activating protein n=1 Tax=Kwoniella heveanensis BCC8398 TaxID=1296120 RepID=A0A1B9GN37_9TREE|nr:GTPase activating protein [Kwoniella heveanensis BCC8398]OCF40600.1 GTPase activating protein [Kwoniella heveanensis CBS 569]